jgi:hypothetical protein
VNRNVGAEPVGGGVKHHFPSYVVKAGCNWWFFGGSASRGQAAHGPDPGEGWSLRSFPGYEVEDRPPQVALRFPRKHYPPDYRVLIYQMVFDL